LGSLTLPGEGSVYIDSNILIYSVERIEPYRTLLEPMWAQAQDQIFDLVSSEIIVLEALVKPIREGNETLVRLLRSMLDSTELQLIRPSREHWELAARLRAETGLKAADALHAATAHLAEVDLLITNDADCRRVEPLPVLVLSDLLAGEAESVPGV